MSTERINDNLGRVLKCDDDGHDYLIPLNLVEEFDQWLDSLDFRDINANFDKYDEYRIENAFGKLIIYEWEEK